MISLHHLSWISQMFIQLHGEGGHLGIAKGGQIGVEEFFVPSSIFSHFTRSPQVLLRHRL
jgi:hypothetical protein